MTMAARGFGDDSRYVAFRGGAGGLSVDWQDE